jgi:hemerythrin-like domain-containing protein
MNELEGAMNITDALTSHHGILRQLFEQSKTDPSVFDEFIHNLVVHHTMEEKYFYDVLEAQPQARPDALEAVNEHHIIELIIKDAERFPRDHERFPVKIESLGEYTTHHLDEEEMKIFPMAEQLLPETDLATLGALFEEAKGKLLGIKLPELPPGVAGKGRKKISVVGKKAGKEPAPLSKGGKVAPQGLGIGSLKK